MSGPEYIPNPIRPELEVEVDIMCSYVVDAERVTHPVMTPLEIAWTGNTPERATFQGEAWHFQCLIKDVFNSAEEAAIQAYNDEPSMIER